MQFIFPDKISRCICKIRWFFVTCWMKSENHFHVFRHLITWLMLAGLTLKLRLQHWKYRLSTLTVQVFRQPKKIPTPNLAFQALGDHRNLKQNKTKINSPESFFRKSPLCTFSCKNPGFGQPWDLLWIFFLIAIFIICTAKECFWPKQKTISCTGSKVPFWKSWKIAPLKWIATIPALLPYLTIKLNEYS